MKYRPIGKMILLSIITLGIYQLFWLIRTRRELMTTNPDVHIPSIWFLFWPVVPLLAGLILLGIQSGSKGLQSSGWATSGLGIIGIVILVLTAISAIVVSLYWFYKYCKAAEVVTKGELTFGLSYSLAIITSVFNVSFIWPFIVQNSFNKIAAPPAATPAEPLSPTATTSPSGV